MIYEVNGFLTFIKNDDAVAYFTKITELIKAEDVLYAKIYLTWNNHHISNPSPDQIIQKIEYGDSSAVLIP
jgi:hypothetical protein